MESTQSAINIWMRFTRSVNTIDLGWSCWRMIKISILPTKKQCPKCGTIIESTKVVDTFRNYLPLQSQLDSGSSWLSPSTFYSFVFKLLSSTQLSYSALFIPSTSCTYSWTERSRIIGSITQLNSSTSWLIVKMTNTTTKWVLNLQRMQMVNGLTSRSKMALWNLKSRLPNDVRDCTLTKTNQLRKSSIRSFWISWTSLRSRSLIMSKEKFKSNRECSKGCNSEFKIEKIINDAVKNHMAFIFIRWTLIYITYFKKR